MYAAPNTASKPTQSLLLKLRARDTVTAEEEQALESLIADVHDVPVGQDLVREGDRPGFSTLLIGGFAGRYKVLEGGGRQITAVHTAGDFVDLHSFMLKVMDHGVVALTACRIGRASHAALRDISEKYPHLMRMLWLATLIDGAIHRQWLVAMGRMTALGHTAHLICEIYLQLAIVHLAQDFVFDFPMTQNELADTLGLSAVHVNRVLQELRRKELIRWEGQRVSILDWERLQEVAQFDPGYLHFVKEPR